MLSERSRNFAVGVTTLTAIVVLMVGIFLLGHGGPVLAGHRGYTIKVVAANANGSQPGTKVDLSGVLVGQVKSVELQTDAAGTVTAKIILEINHGIAIPATAVASLGKSNLGNAYVSLIPQAPTTTLLAQDGSASISAEVGDLGFIPKDVRDNLTNLATQLGTVAKDLHMLLAYNTPEAIEAAKTQPATSDRPTENISTLVIRLNRTMASVEGLIADPKIHGQIRQIVQNVTEASSQLSTTLANIDSTVKNADKAITRVGDTAAQATHTLEDTQKQIVRISEKVVELLVQIEKGTRQLTEGNGTTGKLINDPRLYDGLVDLSKSLRTTVEDLDFLLKKWKDEGVNFKLK